MSFRFNFQINWSTTIFILNLALADLLYCAFNFSFFILLFVHKKWDWGASLCILDANIRYSNALAAWMSVAMVAASLCITIINPGKQTIISSRKNQIFIIVCIRIYGFLLLIPTNLKVNIEIIMICSNLFI